MFLPSIAEENERDSPPPHDLNLPGIGSKCLSPQLQKMKSLNRFKPYSPYSAITTAPIEVPSMDALAKKHRKYLLRNSFDGPKQQEIAIKTKLMEGYQKSMGLTLENFSTPTSNLKMHKFGPLKTIRPSHDHFRTIYSPVGKDFKINKSCSNISIKQWQQHRSRPISPKGSSEMAKLKKNGTEREKSFCLSSIESEYSLDDSDEEYRNTGRNFLGDYFKRPSSESSKLKNDVLKIFQMFLS